MKKKVTYKVQVAYRVWDYVEVTLDADQNENDAKAIAEQISYERNLDEMVVDHDYTDIVERNYADAEATYEMCPYCGTESEVIAEMGVQRCSCCGKAIVICSMCENQVDCRNCEWVKIAREMNKANE